MATKWQRRLNWVSVINAIATCLLLGATWYGYKKTIEPAFENVELRREKQKLVDDMAAIQAKMSKLSAALVAAGRDLQETKAERARLAAQLESTNERLLRAEREGDDAGFVYRAAARCTAIRETTREPLSLDCLPTQVNKDPRFLALPLEKRRALLLEMGFKPVPMPPQGLAVIGVTEVGSPPPQSSPISSSP